MPLGQAWLIVEKTIYGKVTTKSRIHQYPTEPAKKLVLPTWYPVGVVDNTIGQGLKELSKRTYESTVPPKSVASVRTKKIKINPVVPEPWQFKYERDEPYDVSFGKRYVYKYRPSTEPTADTKFDPSTEPTADTQVAEIHPGTEPTASTEIFGPSTEPTTNSNFNPGTVATRETQVTEIEPGTERTQDTTNLTDETYKPINNKPKSILKKSKYPISNTIYSGYFYGAFWNHPGQVRGQVRRERQRDERRRILAKIKARAEAERKEEEAVKIRSEKLKFLEKFWVPIKHTEIEDPQSEIQDPQISKIILIKKEEKEVKEEDFDYFGHLTAEEIAAVKKKVKVEEI